MDPRKLTEAHEAYTTAVEQAEKAKRERDELFRQAKEEGARQADIVKATGLTRETVRRILDPKAAEAVKEAAARRRAEKGRG
ncbi:hypothetical protein [Nocardiopsis sp. NPDC058789]|uniref:hypothetical protein n=1 Tax=Nocardiopsis sp. NPDC058789 TaxID=3346634 RepID=UPI00366DCB5F